MIELLTIGAAGCAALRVGQRLGRRRACRPLWAMPAVPLDALVEGQQQRARGTVSAGRDDLIEAPLTGRPCVAYAFEMFALEWRGRRGTSVGSRASEQSHPPITVMVGAAAVVVELAHATLGLERLRRSPWHRLDRMRRRAVLARKGFARAADNGAWWESILLPGDEVWVGGLVARETDPAAREADRLYRDDLATRVRIVGTAQRPVYVVSR